MSELMLFNIKVYDGSTQNILSHKDQRDSKYPKVCIILLSFRDRSNIFLGDFGAIFN